MRKLTITFTIIILFGLIVVFGMPLVAGIIIEKRYPNMLAKLSRLPDVKAQIVSYDRKWFESSATIRLDIKTQTPTPTSGIADPERIVSFEIKENIKHGPFIFAKTPEGSHTFVFGLALLQNTVALSPESEPLFSSTVWHFNDSLHNTFQSKSFHIDRSPAMNLKVNGLKGYLNYGLSSQRIKTKFSVDSSQLQQTVIDNQQPLTMQLLIKNLLAKADYTSADPLWFGSRELQMALLHITLPNAETFTLNGFAFKVTQTRQDKNTNIALDVTLKNLVNKSIQVNNFKLALTMNDINIQALTNLINDFNRWGSQSAVQKRPINQLVIPSIQLLSRGMSVTLKTLTLSTPDGSLNAYATLSTPPQKDVPNIRNIITGTKADAMISISKILLEKVLKDLYNQTQKAPNASASLSAEQITEKTIADWVNSNLLVEQGTQYICKLHLENGKLLINGKPPMTNQTQQATLLHTQSHS